MCSCLSAAMAVHRTTIFDTSSERDCHWKAGVLVAVPGGNALPSIPLLEINGIGCAGFAAICFPLKLHFGYKIRELYYLPEVLLMLES